MPKRQVKPEGDAPRTSARTPRSASGTSPASRIPGPESREALESDREVDSSADYPIDPERRHRMIEEAAYYRFVERGAAGGDPVDDWLQAETRIDRGLVDRGSADTSPSRASSPRRRPS